MSDDLDGPPPCDGAQFRPMVKTDIESYQTKAASTYSLTDFRRRLLTDWTPPWISGDGVDDSAALARIWQELKAVSSVGAWDSVVVQAGKLLERSLESALDMTSSSRPAAESAQNLPNLQRMLHEAKNKIAALETGAAASSVAGDNIRRIRNISAHFNEFGSTELNATQAIATLLIFVEALTDPDPTINLAINTPVDADNDWFYLHWNEIRPNVFARWFMASDDDAVAPLMALGEESVCERLLQSDSSRALTRLPARMARLHNSRAVFGTVLERNIVSVLSHLSRGKSSNWRRFITPLGVLGLDTHSLVLTTLLPYDSKWLEDQLISGSSPYVVTRLVNRMRTGSHQQWELLGGTDDARRDRVARAAWRGWQANPTLSFASNRFLLAKFAPPNLGPAIVHYAPREALLGYFINSQQFDQLVRIIRFAFYDRTLPDVDREEIWQVFLRRLRLATFQNTRNLPFVVHVSGMTSGFMGNTILQECIERPAIGSEDRRMLAKTLFLTWLVSRELRTAVTQRARRLADQAPLDWATMMCAGLIDISDGPPLRLAESEVNEILNQAMPPEGLGHDELGLVLLGSLSMRGSVNACVLPIYDQFQASPAPRDHVLPGHLRFDNRLIQMSRILEGYREPSNLPNTTGSTSSSDE
jgi:hypothetical protein